MLNANLDSVKFLQALGASHTFQVFAESPEAKAQKLPPVVLNGTYEEYEARLKGYNDNGYGVYVTVSQTDGKGRTKDNIVAPRALFLDFDGNEPDPELLALLPEPSAIVQSKNGKHLYWLLKPEQPLAELEPTLKQLIDYMGSDPACKDMGRVLRIPGTIHHKTEPFATSLISLNDKRYTFSDVVGSIPKTHITPKAHKAPKVNTPLKPLKASKITADNFHSNLRAIPVADQFGWVLEAVSNCTEGGRNNLLNTAAYWAYGLTVKGVPAIWLRDELSKAALAAGLDSNNIDRTLDSAFTAACEAGVGQTKAQKVWLNLDRMYGNTAVYDLRSLFVKVDGVQPKLAVERVNYINATGEDISLQRFCDEFTGWLQKNHSIDPYMAYLDGLPSMATQDAWKVFDDLAVAMGIQDPNLTRLLVRHRIGAIARTYRPGCSMQYALGLVGDAGCGKSSYFESYSPDSGHCVKVGAGIVSDKAVDKDTWLGMLSAVVVDMDEIDTICSSSSFARLKGNISKSSCTIRPPYEKAVEAHPIRFVWGFTSNSDTPLHDDGANNRRYVVIKMSGNQKDGKRRHEYYNTHRDSINAAAKALYDAGESWELSDDELAVQAVQTESHVERSLPYSIALQLLPKLAAKYDARCRTEVRGLHIDQIYRLCTPEGRPPLYPAEKKDIGKALKSEGWLNIRVRREGAQQSLWVPKNIDAGLVVGMYEDSSVNAAAMGLGG
jgi:hypothetical protein